MGSWGTGLYQNDSAADVKMVFADLSRRPTDTATLVAEVLEKLAPEGEEEADVWLAFADLLHLHALDHPEVMTRARALIETGEDLEVKRSLGMSPRDLEKRAKVLEEVLARWSAPHPKPKKRKATPAPEPFLLEVGEVWTFPAMHHAARPFHVKEADPAGFTPDGWGAFAVADRFHSEGYRASYLFILAVAGGAARPDLEALRRAPVQDCTFAISGPPQSWTYPMIFAARLAKRKQGLKAWEAVRAGTLPFDANLVRSHLPERLSSRGRYNARDPDGIAWLEEDLTTTSYHKAASNARTGLSWTIAPHPTLRLGDLCGG